MPRRHPSPFILHPSSFILSFLLLSSLTLADTPHTFQYQPPDPTHPPKTVAVAGDFNGWSTSATPMTRSPDGSFSVTLPLPDGIHYYKFVLNGNTWTPDPKYSDKSLEQDDNYGGRNSAVMIGFDARKLPPPAPNHINPDAVFFDPKDPQDLNVAGDGLVRFRIRTQANDVQRVVAICSWRNLAGRAESLHVPLDRVGSDRGLDVYSTTYQFPTDQLNYALDLIDGTDELVRSAAGLNHSLQTFQVDLRPAFTTPDWAKDAIWYQVFPERFRNGDPANDPPNTKRWTSNWFSTLPDEAPGPQNFYKGVGNVWKRRYGGDVQGLKQSLPYLKSLGITAIYLNPMFEAESMHKYDATDYRHIDEFFGVKGDYEALRSSGQETDDPATWTWTPSDKLFLDFVAEAHKQGFKVILDGVFNHVGRDFWAFQDVLKKGKRSKYASWFDIRDWGDFAEGAPRRSEAAGSSPRPIKYIAWDTGGEPTDHGALPVLKKDPALGLVPGPREHILAVTQRWLAPDGDPNRGVDGFRLDVPGDIPHPFWITWRQLVKQTKPDAYISGEIWDWAQPWLRGDQFDAVMNYRFAIASQEFFVNQKKALTPTEFSSRLSQLVNAYPLQVSLVQMNLFDSHDTDRAASMFVNPDLPYDAANRIQDNGPHYSPAKPTQEQWTRFEQEVTFQMTFLGAPMIYYGDEAGMWSPDDPSNRQPMLWRDLEPYDDPQITFNATLFNHYQRLIAIRSALKPLRWGSFRPLLADDKTNTFAFSRTLGPQTVYVALNRSPNPQTLTLPVTSDQPLLNWLDPAATHLTQSPTTRPSIEPQKNVPLLHPTNGTIRLTLKPYGSAVLSAPN